VTRAWALGDPLGGRKRFAVLFEPLDAEQLRDDGFGVVSLASGWAGDADRPLPCG
jgi:hypothetical protein